MGAEKIKVLVADDNLNFLQLFQLALDPSEFDVVTATDGQEGFILAQSKKPDIILSDVMMPKVSGLEFLRLLLSDEETRDIPVLVLTASHFDPSTEMVFKQEHNVKGFLQKPCPVSVMKEAIAAALKK
jgi:CheY-like chemotaxis protein